MLDRAFNFGDSNVASTTVNGVKFDAYGVDISAPVSVSFGDTTITAIGGNGGVQSNTGVFGVGASPYNTLSSNYQSLLNSGVYNGHGDLHVDFNGLTAGTTYLLQLFVNDSRAGYHARSESVTDGVGDAVTLNYNSTNADGGLGQFVTGTFLATSSSTSIDLLGMSTDPNFYNTAQLDGLQLRATGTVATPLPLSAWGGLALISVLGVVSAVRVPTA